MTAVVKLNRLFGSRCLCSDDRWDDATRAVLRACQTGRVRFEALAQRLLQRHAQGGIDIAAQLEGMLPDDAAVCRGAQAGS